MFFANRTLFRVCLLMTMVFFPRCAWTTDSHTVHELHWLDTADARRDLAAALERGDTRFIAVMGFALITPGISIDSKLVRRHGYREIAGTSDVLHGKEESRLNFKAGDYAERYNRLLLQHFKKHDSN